MIKVIFVKHIIIKTKRHSATGKARNLKSNCKFKLVLEYLPKNVYIHGELTWPRGYKTFSYSTLLSLKFVLLIKLKLLTVTNSFLLNIADNENFSVNKYENAIFKFNNRNFHAQLSKARKKFYNLKY